MYGMIFWSNKK